MSLFFNGFTLCVRDHSLGQPFLRRAHELGKLLGTLINPVPGLLMPITVRGPEFRHDFGSCRFGFGELVQFKRYVEAALGSGLSDLIIPSGPLRPQPFCPPATTWYSGQDTMDGALHALAGRGVQRVIR